MSKVKWSEAIKPLLKKYKGKSHPLEFKNLYQLVIMVILSARDSDKHINQLAPAFFEVFPDMKALAKANPEILTRYLHSVRNFANKVTWLTEIGKTLKTDRAIPQDLEGLTALPGIGRKSANVILRESGKSPEGVIVDLHVVRVAPRLGIASGKDPKKIEAQIMEALPPKQWDAGMALSFLGREICRPTNPKCEICVMNPVCAYYRTVVKNKVP